MPGAWKYRRISNPIGSLAVTLTAIASRPEGYFMAPEAYGRAGILRGQIAVALPCRAGTFWGGR
jgi:hypothetical protein